MEFNINTLQNISSTNLKFDYVIIAQDWHCYNMPGVGPNQTVWPSKFSWKYNKNDELCEGPDFLNSLSTSNNNCNEVSSNFS